MTAARSRSGWAWLLLATLLPLAACQTDTINQSDGQPCMLDFMGSLPLLPSARHLALNGAINAIPVRLWFDTGGFSTILRQEDGKRLGLRASGFGLVITGLGGGQYMGVVHAHTIDVGHMHGEAFPLGLANVSVPPDIDGMIGMDFFSRTDLDIDMPADRLNLYQPRHDCTHPSVFLHGNLASVPLLGARPGHAYLAGSMASQPRITITINGVALKAGLDTGAPRNVLFADGAEKLGIGAVQTAKDPLVLAGGIGLRKMQAPLHLMPAVSVGDLELQNIHAVVLPDHLLGLDMILGVDFFRTMHIWISHSSGTVILQYPPEPSPLDEAALSGPASPR
jgi:predicted aspartyl protease